MIADGQNSFLISPSPPHLLISFQKPSNSLYQ